MAIVDALLYRRADPHTGGYLPPDELLRRVTARFPLALIDRERGDRIVRDHLVSLAEVSAPPAILNEWRAMEGQVAHVTVRGEEGGPQFGFFLQTRPTLIEIDYQRSEERDASRPLLEALAAALEYDILTEDIVDEDLDD